MTTVPTGARPRHGRSRHRDSPRARARARHESTRAEAPTVAGAQLTSVVEVDLTATTATDVLATVVTAAARAAAAHPSVVRFGGVHIGVLAADGETSFVVRDADELTDVALAARLDAGEHAGIEPTLLVADTGSRGVLLDTPAVGPDRTAVLGIGAVVRRPVVRDTDGGEVIVARSMAYLSLSHDAELLDGAEAAGFLRSAQRVIEEGSA